MVGSFLFISIYAGSSLGSSVVQAGLSGQPLSLVPSQLYSSSPKICSLERWAHNLLDYE